MQTDDYDALWRWSVDELEDFWAPIWECLSVQARNAVRARAGLRATCPAPSGSRARRLNYAEHVFRGTTTTPWRSTTPPSCASWATVTWGELREQVARIAAGLRALGVEPRRPRGRLHAEHPRGRRGVPRLRVDRRGLVVVLARLRRAQSVVDRFAQIEPKVLLAVDGYRYGGKDFDRRDVVAGHRGGDADARAHRVLGYLDGEPARQDGLSWGELDGRASAGVRALPFDHPLWVLY